MTRDSRRQNASCAGSSAPRSAACTVVVTSMPRSARARAIAWSMCSSRWNRTSATAGRSKLTRGLLTRGIDHRVIGSHLSVDLDAMVVIVRKRRVDRRRRQVVLLRDRLDRLVLAQVPHNDVLDRDAPPRDARLAAEHAWVDRDVLV